jgi:thioredoxin reductase (NADPH)
MIHRAMQIHDVVIVGAGPAGLAAAIAAGRAGLSSLVLEKGALVNSIQHFPVHMVFFTTPELLEIGDLPFVTPYEKPTRLEALRYYRRVVDALRLDVELDEEVTHIREDRAPDRERVLAVDTRSSRGMRRVRQARSVVIATGAYDKPNLLNVPGEDLPHVSHYYREAHPYYRRAVVIVGGKNSAAEAALELFRSGARVTLVHRRPALGESIKYWVRPDIENRIKEGSIAAHFSARVVEIRPTEVVVECAGGREGIPADAVLLLTGYHSDTTLFGRAGVAFDADTCAPAIDAATFETNVPGIHVIGAAITGRNSGQIFIENGRLHGQQVIDVIARRLRPAVADLRRSG